MWGQFYAQNAHFAISLLAALVFTAVCWLYLDSWRNARQKKELFRWLGFGGVGLSFFLQATIIEQSALGDSLFGDTTRTIVGLVRLASYVLIIVSQLIDPLMPEPDVSGLEAEDFNVEKDSKSGAVKKSSGVFAPATASFFALPLASAFIAFLYLRRATKGLERHLLPIGISFVFFAVSDALYLTSTLRDSANPTVFNAVQAFGPLWIAQQIILAVGVVILGRWIWYYLTKRFFSQLFMIFMSMAVAIFLVVIVSFTALLIHNVRTQVSDNLTTAADVLQYALDSKQTQAHASARLLASNADVASGITNKDRQRLIDTTKDFLTTNKLNDFFITDASGQLLARGQDASQHGNSLSSDPLIRRALLGSDLGGVVSTDGVVAPTLNVRSAVAVHDAAGTIIGVVMTSLQLDNAFVDGINKSTGLESSIYAGNTLSATTLLDDDGKTRTVGTRITKDSITKPVLTNGEIYKGPLELQGIEYLAVGSPVKDVDNVPIGMLMIAEKESHILRLAGRSVELSFVFEILFILLSILPVAYITRSIERQI